MGSTSGYARLLAVVSLHMNTFKPHANTKTSILFLQTWNDDRTAGPLNPKKDDYPIFMAISRRGGKTSNGNYIFRRDTSRSLQLDAHGHPVVEHDLDEVARSFIKFAKKQRLGFQQE